MKLPWPILLVLTTTILVVTAVLAALQFPFQLIFYLTVSGQFLLVITVFCILKDNYTTKKNFDDFYEDHPIGREERYLENGHREDGN